jgi:ClpP protease-like protein
VKALQFLQKMASMNVRHRICGVLVALLAVLSLPAMALDSGLTEARQLAKRCKGAASVSLAAFKDRDVLCLKGEIDKQMAEDITKRLRLRPRNLVVVIDSAGGSVVRAINIADMLSAHGFDLIVTKACYSSCANYLFVAANDKFLLEDADIGWHGSTAPRSFGRYIDIFFAKEKPIGARALKKLRKHYEASKHAQEDFVQRYEFSEEIYFAHWSAYACAAGAPTWNNYRGAEGQRVFSVRWRPSLFNMQNRYGIANVVTATADDYAGNAVSVTLDDGERELVSVSDRCLFKSR